VRIPEKPLDFIRSCIVSQRIRWTYHATMRLAQRSLTSSMLTNPEAALEILENYPDDKYLPSYLVRVAADGALFHAQIAIDTEGNNIRVVTMYWPNPLEWSLDFRARKERS
jgi:hypothetical protein